MTVTFTLPVAALPFTRAVPAVTVVTPVLTSVKSLALPIRIAPLMALAELFSVTSPGLKMELAAKIALPATVNLPVFTMLPAKLRASRVAAVMAPRLTVWLSIRLSVPVPTFALI